jgi:hypothetical protein
MEEVNNKKRLTQTDVDPLLYLLVEDYSVRSNDVRMRSAQYVRAWVSGLHISHISTFM